MDNLKVIMLDDEVLIRKLIKMKLNAKDLNIEIVGEYSNASSALSVLKDLKPDIVISDICMPEVDGISFSEQCTEILPNIKIIIVTGYNDFEYARRSLKAGVYDYLMKPIQADELNNSLRKAVNQIRKDKEEKELRERILEERKKDLPLLINSLLNQMLINDVYDISIERKLISYGVNVGTSKGLQIGLIAVQESIIHPEILGEIKAETELFFQSEKNLFILLDSWGRIVIVCLEEVSSFEECLELLINIIEKKWGYILQVGYSSKNSTFKNIRSAYVDALDNMCHRHGKRKRIDEKNVITNYKEEWSSLFDSMNRGKTTDALLILDKIFAPLNNKTKKININKNLASKLFEKMCIETQQNSSKFEGFHKLNVCFCENDIIRCIYNTVMNISIQKAILKEGEKGRLMNRVICYMEENLHDSELNMNILLNKFAISSSLFCRLFKTFTGKTYSDFLSELRVWRMMELIAEDFEMRDRDIGEKIGIKDPHYLSIWFRKMTGYSVTEYRKMRYDYPLIK